MPSTVTLKSRLIHGADSRRGAARRAGASRGSPSASRGEAARAGAAGTRPAGCRAGRWGRAPRGRGRRACGSEEAVLAAGLRRSGCSHGARPSCLSLFVVRLARSPRPRPLLPRRTIHYGTSPSTRQACFRKWRRLRFFGIVWSSYHFRRWQQERTARLSRLAAALREPLPRLLLAGPSRRCRRSSSSRSSPAGSGSASTRLSARRPRRCWSLAGLAIWTLDRVLAPPPGLPLGARPPASAPHPLHHPRRPPRPSQRRAAPGDAARREHPARRPLLRRSSG